MSLTSFLQGEPQFSSSADVQGPRAAAAAGARSVQDWGNWHGIININVVIIKFHNDMGLYYSNGLIIKFHNKSWTDKGC